MSRGLGDVYKRQEILVNEVVDALKERFEIKTHLVETATESVNFKVPRILREAL